MARFIRQIADMDGERQTVLVDAARVESRCEMEVSVATSFGWKIEKEQAEIGEWYCNDGLCRYLMPACVFKSLYKPYMDGVPAH